MRYWDSSAIVPLMVSQNWSDHVERELRADSCITTWWGTSTECYSALMRLVRQGALDARSAELAQQRLRKLGATWDEVLPSEACRTTAERMLRVHPLRAADALQLAAALVAADHDPTGLEFVCLDERLTEAARKEGFILGPGDVSLCENRPAGEIP